MHNNDANETILYLQKGHPNEFLNCTLAGITYPRADHREYHAAAESSIFCYVTSGAGQIEGERETRTVTAGDFFFIRKGTSVYLCPDAADPWEKLWVHMDGAMTEELVRAFRLTDITVAKKNVRSQFIALHETLSAMKERTTPDGAARMACLLFEILTEVRKEDFFLNEGEPVGTAAAIKAYLDNNLYNDISLDTVATEFGISKMHVIRLFKKEFGITPIRYQLERKIAIAKNLLSGTVMPIREISDLLRFSNTQHFSNTFRNEEGISPNKYRTKARKGL